MLGVFPYMKSFNYIFSKLTNWSIAHDYVSNVLRLIHVLSVWAMILDCLKTILAADDTRSLVLI